MTGWRRYVAAGVVVLGVYMGLAFLNSPRGFLGTDTGGKVATFEVMSESGRFDPDLGYWAERWDPDGTLHPIGYTSHTASGKWVNVTTLPALWVGWQLYRVGGYRASLLVPMVGSLAAAFAGLALLRRLGVRSEPWAWAGFFVLALASPLTIYALDFWEHSVGVALMAWAVVLLCDVLSGAVAWGRRVVGAGVLFGAAATMRTESLVYLAIAGAALVAVPLWSRRRSSGGPERARKLSVATVLASPLLVVSAAVPLLVNEVVERRVVGSTIRATRVLGTAASVGDLPTDRLREAAVTLVGLEGSDLGIALGLLFAALLVFAAARTDAGIATTATAAAGAVLVVRGLAGGLGFVPGLAAAWVLPASTIGRAHNEMTVRPRPNVRRFVSTVAVGAAPIVLATQFRGGAGPQWGGRYLLVTGFLLAVVGWAALGAKPLPVRIAVVALAVAVTGFGVAWLRIRSHDVARTIAALEARPEEVIVSDVYHLAREGGATYGDKRWLTLTDRRADAPAAAAVLRAADVQAFASIQTGGADRLDFPGFEPADRATLRLFDGVDLRITRWEATP